MTVIGSYTLSKVNIRVECEDKQLYKNVHDAFTEGFFINSTGSTHRSPDIILKFRSFVCPFHIPETALELFSSSSIQVLKDRDVCYLRCGNTIHQMDLINNNGIACMDSAFWKGSPKSKQDFFMLSLLWLLRNHGLYAVHGNTLVKENLGILFVGHSCSGKSTLSYSLMRQGWRCLSDDVTLLQHDFGRTVALPLPKGFSVDPVLAGHYQELKKPMSTASYNGHKRFLPMHSLYPESFLSSCTPKIIIFPKIVSQQNSRLVAIDKVKALILLLENAGGIMVDQKIATNQMTMMRDLVQEITPYQLFAGRDLYEHPEKISYILSGINISDKNSSSCFQANREQKALR